jgi:hypothetical protein
LIIEQCKRSELLSTDIHHIFLIISTAICDPLIERCPWLLRYTMGISSFVFIIFKSSLTGREAASYKAESFYEWR